MGASLFVQVQILPDFSLSHLLEGINTQVLKRFVSKHNIQQVTGLAIGGQRHRHTHTTDGWGKREGQGTDHALPCQRDLCISIQTARSKGGRMEERQACASAQDRMERKSEGLQQGWPKL